LVTKEKGKRLGESFDSRLTVVGGVLGMLGVNIVFTIWKKQKQDKKRERERKNNNNIYV
jgi:hypothetical protein